MTLAAGAAPGLILFDMAHDWPAAHAPVVDQVVGIGGLLVGIAYVAAEFGPKVWTLLRRELTKHARMTPRAAELVAREHQPLH